MNAIERFSGLEIKNIVLWVGAGISRSGPTSLPLGWDLTKFALKETCGIDVQEKIFAIWEKANELTKTSPDNPAPLGLIPRLESILGEIDDIQTNLVNYDFNFLQGFSAFQDAPYNQNHLYIANMLKQGATVITTNFDLCIQNAYKDLATKQDLLVPKDEKGVISYSSRKSETTGKIWHIHGVSKETTSLGTTVKKVKEGIPEHFQKYLDEIIEQGKLFVFLGYSASDSFDVNIYFQNKHPTPGSHAAFIQHGNKEVKPPYNAYQLGKCFREFIVENYDTTTFLSKFSKNQGKVPEFNFEWEDAFKSNVVSDQKGITKYLLICKIANMLGINIHKIEPLAYQRALKMEKYYENIDFHKTLAIVQRTRGDSKKEKMHDITVHSKDIDLLGYYYSQGDYKKALQYAKSYEELYSDSMNISVELDWTTYTSMSAHCRPLVTKYLKSPFAKPSPSDLAKLNKLIKLTDILGNRPLRNVRYINQIVTALRFSLIFNAIIGNDDKENEKTILHLYGEGASIVGYVSAFRDIAIKNYFLAKHHRDKVLFKEAQKYAVKSYEIADLIGEHSGIKRAKRLINSFKVLSPLYW